MSYDCNLMIDAIITAIVCNCSHLDFLLMPGHFVFEIEYSFDAVLAQALMGHKCRKYSSEAHNCLCDTQILTSAQTPDSRLGWGEEQPLFKCCVFALSILYCKERMLFILLFEVTSEFEYCF